ncbi:Yip1 family protein [Plastoroseomonas arctica]|uniref:YIP1 family protein n=1 Tax=Plastoroseomonas arctica TaxID=1509237 RepID=A0AAF1KMF7_9PROT|nr:Yip1 family protein [Plastoroseomonas arctica]MBR0656336.1 YIP1 family protein [Plastoroseomonas arctica]
MVDIVTRAKNLIMTPKSEWAVISLEPTDTKQLFTGYVMLMAAIPAVCGFIGLTLFLGMFRGAMVLVPGFLVSTVVSYVLSLVAVFVMAKIIPILAPKFGGSDAELPAMKLAAYAPTASWLAGVFLLIPGIGFLAALLGLYSIYLYYLGAIAVVKVPEDKAIVFTIVLFVVALVIFLVIGAVANALRF